MNKDKKVILKVLVGSQAHGLANKNSDYDYRAVYILPTSKILSLDYRYKGNDWIEGKEDNTAYEIGHFLKLAIKCNPTILEVFKAPIVKCNEDGKKLRALFSYVWNSQDAFNAFVGYGLNQRKKFLNKKDNRQNKYAVAYIRTLWNLCDLLKKENFEIKVGNKWLIGDILQEFKKGNYTVGEVINYAETFTQVAREYLENLQRHKPNLNKVNNFLIDIRKRYWKI